MTEEKQRQKTLYFCIDPQIISTIQEKALNEMAEKDSAYELSYDVMTKEFETLRRNNKKEIGYLQNQQNILRKDPSDFCYKTNESSWRGN